MGKRKSKGTKAPSIPYKNAAQKRAEQTRLHVQYPVSSGNNHFTNVSTSLTSQKKREDGGVTYPSAELIMKSWALSQQKNGKYTGSTGVKILSQKELAPSSWAKKNKNLPQHQKRTTFQKGKPQNKRLQTNIKPVASKFGMKMLQKMGWQPGEGLGKNKEGTIEPLVLDVKRDKKGLHAQNEQAPKKASLPISKDLCGKHPVSFLIEHCTKQSWLPPQFTLLSHDGPPHNKHFMFQVTVNGRAYKPTIMATTKKLAKANAAAAFLQAYGIVPPKPLNSFNL